MQLELAFLSSPSNKRIKLSVAPSEPIDSFGWGDFPLILATEEEYSSTPPCCKTKRKEHPIVLRSELVEDSVPTTFGWGDFPCVDESDEYSPSVYSTPIATSSLLESIHVVTSSDDEMDSEEDDGTSMVYTNSNVSMDSTSTRSSRVDFRSTVQVRAYNITMGDHPYAPDYALSLDWEYAPEIEEALQDQHDELYFPRTKPRRLTSWERRERLVQMDVVC